jgi:PAS domain S-box-containing protein
MKQKTLIGDVQRNQFVNIIIFGLLIFILMSFFTWNQTKANSKERLLTLDKILELTIKEHQSLLIKCFQKGEISKARKLIASDFHDIIRTYPHEYTAGFYSRELDRVVVSVSNYHAKNRYNYVLSSDDPTRRAWQLRRPQYSILWSGAYRTWLLECDYPVIVDGRVFGHTFANIAFSALILLYCRFGLAVLFTVMIVGYLSFFTLFGITRLIGKKGDQGAAAWFLDVSDRVNAQRIVEKTNAKIANILESISEAFIALDRDWRFTYINQTAEKFLHQQRRDELIGKSIWETYSDGIDSKFYYEYHRVMKERIPSSFEILNGDVWLEYHVYPYDEGISVFIREITERKLSEKTNRKLAGIIETSADAIISMSLDGKITSWNQGAIKLYGFNAEEVLGKSFLLTFPAESHERMGDGLIKLNQGQVFEDNCAVGIRKNGTRIYVSIKSSLIRDNAGNIAEFSSIHRDITELIIFEEALAKERELLMVTLNSLTEGVIATDAEDRIFLFNDAAVSLTGYSQMEAVDEPLDKILFIIDDKTSEPVTYITSQATIQFQRMPRNLILVTRDLKEIPISAHSSPIKSSNSSCSIIGAVTVFQDITEKQKTEQELSRADKLESLGILAGGIAHDFNNILAAILSNIQLAQMKYNKNQDIAKYLRESIESTHRASELTRQLLTFSRGGAPVKKAASLAELIDDTAKFALRGSKAKVTCKISKTLWPVEVDAGQISQVIYNLVINAKQAMPRGGIVEISAENTVNELGHRFNPGNYVKIEVKDQGIGIPMENLTKIFDPFFTTKNEGSGLGLTTSYSIIKQHDGYLEVESEVGMGTTFTIYLPASLQPLILPELKKEASLTIERLKILLMDDEQSVLKSMGELLEFYGHQAILTVDGSEAVKEYRKALEEGLPFDVVIMDLTVPGGIGGQEAITHLLSIDPNVKAIVSSGYANDPIIADYERFGFSGVVTKPYKFDELNRVLNRVMGSKQLRLELDYKYGKDNLHTMNG